jgi:hypothetical protein
MSLMQDGSLPTAQSPVRVDRAPRTVSDILRGLTDQDADRIYVGDLVDAFGPRAFGALMFAFSLLALVAAVPGSSAVTAAPIIIIAVQLIIGVPNLWLPKAIDRRSLKRDDLKNMLDRVLPTLERVERFLAPRLEFLFGSVGDRMVGTVCLLLAVVLALPIPFFNLVPGMGVATLSLALVARDGLLALIGYGIAAASGVVLTLSAHAVFAAVERVIGLFVG